MPKNPEFARKLPLLRGAFRLSIRGLARLACGSGDKKEIHNLYNRIRGWEVKGNEPAWSELAPVIHEIAAAYGPLADADENELVTMNWLLIDDPLPAWLTGRVRDERVGGATVPDVSTPTLPVQPPVFSILDPARSLLSSAVKAGAVSAEAAEAAITVLARAALSFAQTSSDQLEGTASTRKFIHFGRVAA